MEIELRIERLGVSGEGVGYHNGYTLFVDGALPGETIRARIYEKRKNFGRATLLEVLIASPHRVKPPCPVFGRCGGCQIMHLSYAEQLVFKRQRVVDALERIGKLFSLPVFPCEPSPSPLSYRNKIQLPVGPNFTMGLYAKNSHDIVPVEKCYIHCDLGEKAFQQIRQLLLSSPPFNLRYVLIKTAVHTGQVLVVLVTQERELLSSIGNKIMAAMPQVKGVVQNINPAEGNVALSTEFHTLAGQPIIEEEILGLKFNVSAASFFQVNPAQAENLYRKTLQLAALQGTERLLDAYCGVGTLSLLLAKEAKEVIGVESVSQAVADAIENGLRNGITNVRFTCGLAEEFIATLSNIDIAVLNPPRKGCEPVFLEKLSLLHPKKILYISCDPATLARDLALLEKSGYKTKEVHPFDMFPQTAHVESLAMLELI